MKTLDKNPHKQSWNKLFTFPIFIFLSLFVQPKLYSQDSNLPHDPYAGQNIFIEKGCNTCHSLDGESNKSGPNLHDQKKSDTFLGIAAIMWNHLPTMFEKSDELNLTFQEFKADEVSQLMAYLCFLRYSNTKGNFFIGNKLLENKDCLKCHSMDGSGIKQGPDFRTINFYVSPIFMAQAMWNHGPEILKAAKDKDIQHIKLDAKHFIDITAALQELNRSSLIMTEYSTFGNIKNGKRLFSEKGCKSCHDSSVRAQTKAPDLKNLELRKGVIEIVASMWNHGPEMWQEMKAHHETYPVFKGEEMSDLIAYLFYDQYTTITGNPEKGREVFEKKTCKSCHAVNSSETDNSELIEIPVITDPIEMVYRMWNHAPVMNENIKKQNIDWPKFKEQEMMDLYAFLSKANK